MSSRVGEVSKGVMKPSGTGNNGAGIRANESRRRLLVGNVNQSVLNMYCKPMIAECLRQTRATHFPSWSSHRYNTIVENRVGLQHSDVEEARPG